MLDIKRNGYERIEPLQPKPAPQAREPWFGEFDDTGIGADLTLEWDSTDPDLHSHQTQPSQTEDEGEDYYRYYREAGLPDG
jgi:hypothetical protein